MSEHSETLSETSAQDDRPLSVQAFVAIGPSDDGSVRYRPIEEVANDEALRAFVLEQMDQEWRAARQEYEDHKKFFDRFARDSSKAS